MPNWCENTLEIYGEEEDMQQFYDFFLGQDKIQENFSFDAITTMPKALEGTRSPSQIIPQNHYDLLEKFKHEIDFANNPKLESTEKEKTMVSKVIIDYIENKEFSELESVNEILKQFFLDTNDGITKETSDRLISEYGFDNWYDWRNHNWGTKWDIRGDCGNDIIDDDHCTFIFQTAWSPPEPIVKKLQEMFPKLQIYGGYVGEGFEYAGVFE